MNDCNEAMVKIKMAFSHANAATNAITNNTTSTTGSSNNNNNVGLNVTNFGEFDEAMDAAAAMMTGGGVFAVDMELLDQDMDGEWLDADAADQQDNIQSFEQQQQLHENDDDELNNNNAMNTTNMTLESEMNMPQLNTQEQEEWGAFDPEAAEQEEEEDKLDQPHNFDIASDVSSIEVAREGDVSRNTMSTLNITDLDASSSKISTNNPAGDDDDVIPDVDFNNDLELNEEDIMFSPGGGGGHTATTDDIRSNKRRNSSLGIGGLDVTTDTGSASQSQSQLTVTRSKKRRKIVVDNENIDLGSDVLRANLNDWSHTMRHRVHPADRRGISNSSNEQEDIDDFVRRNAAKSAQELLHMPTRAAELAVADELLEMFEHVRCRRWKKKREVELLEEMEEARNDDAEVSAEEEAANLDELDVTGKLESEFPVDDDFNNVPVSPEAMPEQDMDFEMQEPETAYNPFELEEDGTGTGGGRNSLDSEFSLGAVNSNTGAGSTEWHPHTTKVLSVIHEAFEKQQDTSKVHDDDGNEDDNENTYPSLSYMRLTKGTSRHTAIGVFFELLQLKSLDYIEVQHTAGPYSDVKIQKGPKFDAKLSDDNEAEVVNAA